MAKTIFNKTIYAFFAIVLFAAMLMQIAGAEGTDTVVATVTTNGTTQEYTSIGTAWVDALKASKSSSATIKLFADWIAENGKFYCTDSNGNEYGTWNGRLHMATSSMKLTIDLNGYKIDRNLSTYTSHGQVFRIEAGSLTITDTSETKNGTITGGCKNHGANNIEDNVCLASTSHGLSHALAQTTGVSNAPLAEGAMIGVNVSGDNSVISADGGNFLYDSHKYFSADNADCYIRPVYNSTDTNNTYRLYYTNYANSASEELEIEYVSVKAQELISQTILDTAENTVTLKAITSEKSAFEGVSLDSLVSYTLSEDCTSVDESSTLLDLSEPHDYKVMGNSGAYVVYTVKIEWPACSHEDEDENAVCDDCEESLVTKFAVESYDSDTNTAKILLFEAGAYAVIFADYEGGLLKNVEFAVVTATEPQAVTASITGNFTLSSGDKIMLVINEDDFIPLCEAYVFE